MKTIARIYLSVSALSAVLLLSSCATSQQVSHQGKSSPQRVNSEGCWYQVRQDPPVYYPVGVSKDAVTDYRHGDWIVAGKGGALWFVPFGGAKGNSADELIQQAFAMRTDEQKSLIRRDGVREAVFATIGTTALTVTTVATTAAQATSTSSAAYIDPKATWTGYGNALDQSPFLGALEVLRFREKLYAPESVAKVSRGPSRPGDRANDDQSVSSLNKEADAILLEDGRGAVNANKRSIPRARIDIGDPVALPSRPD